MRAVTPHTSPPMSHLPQFLLDAPTLKLCLWIAGVLLLLTILRIIFLVRANTRLRDNFTRMDQRVRVGQEQIHALRNDDAAWRGALQHLQDTFRTEFSNRIVESERRCQDIVSRQWALTRPLPPTSLTTKESEATSQPPADSPAPAAPQQNGMSPLPAIV